jgi:hypothetical protein
MGQKLTRYATTEKAITLADSPYTASPNFNCIKVNTAGGNVRVNLPTADYPIDVIKTSSDSYIVTVWVGGVQIGEVCGELSKITIENADVTQDEPWYPYDAIVGIAGVSGDGGEVLAKDRFGRVIAGGRGVAGTDDAMVVQSAIDLVNVSGGGRVVCGDLNPSTVIVIKNGVELVVDCGKEIAPSTDHDIIQITRGGKLQGRIVAPAWFTSTAVLLNDFFFFDGVALENVYLYCPTRTGKAVELRCIVDNGIAGVEGNFTSWGFEYGLYGVTSGIQYINSNRLHGTILSAEKMIWLSDSAGGEIDVNSLDFTIETNANSSNRVNVYIIDWGHAATTNAVILESTSLNNYVFADVQPTYITDLGINNTVINQWARKLVAGYVKTIYVSPSGGDYISLSSALNAIVPSSASRYAIVIDGLIDETDISITHKSNVDILSRNGRLLCESFIIPTNAVTNIIGLDITINSVGGTIGLGNVTNSCIFDGCKFRRISPSTPTTSNIITMEGTSSPIIKNCVFYSDTFVSSTSGYCIQLTGLSYPTIKNTIISFCNGGGTNKSGIYIGGNSIPRLGNVKVAPENFKYSWLYTSDNNGRFRPFDSIAYEVVGVLVYVSTATSALLSIGSSIGGSQIASNIDISTTGMKYFTVNDVQISAGAYIYATPSISIPESSLTVYYIVRYDARGCYAVKLAGHNRAVITNSTLDGIASSATLLIDNANILTRVSNSRISNLNTALYSASPISGQHIKNCSIYGSITNITGIDGKSSGFSTGTGSEQTIPHGLLAIPTGCKAWKKIEYPVGSGRYITIDIPFDATNVYPTVDNGVAFEWGIA